MLEPFPVILWGPIELAYLGVPIVVGVRFTVLTRARCQLTINALIQLHMIVVSDEHYQSSIRKLVLAKFHKALPTRGPPEFTAMVPHMKKREKSLMPDTGP